MQRLYRKLPLILKTILLTSEGWLVGGAINKLLANESPRDYDIIVPSRELFQIVTNQLYTYAEITLTSFGGLKFKLSDEIEVDIWCEELDHFLKTANKVDYVYNFKKNILLKKD